MGQHSGGRPSPNFSVFLAGRNVHVAPNKTQAVFGNLTGEDTRAYRSLSAGIL